MQDLPLGGGTKGGGEAPPPISPSVCPSVPPSPSHRRCNICPPPPLLVHSTTVHPHTACLIRRIRPHPRHRQGLRTTPPLALADVRQVQPPRHTRRWPAAVHARTRLRRRHLARHTWQRAAGPHPAAAGRDPAEGAADEGAAGGRRTGGQHASAAGVPTGAASRAAAAAAETAAAVAVGVHEGEEEGEAVQQVWQGHDVHPDLPRDRKGAQTSAAGRGEVRQVRRVRQRRGGHADLPCDEQPPPRDVT